jgi:hypothetical protein
MRIPGDIKNYLRRFASTMLGIGQPLYENALTAKDLEGAITSLKDYLDDPPLPQ